MQSYSEFADKTFSYISERADEAMKLHRSLGSPKETDRGIGVMAVRTEAIPDDRLVTQTAYVCSGPNVPMFIRLMLVSLSELIHDAGLSNRLDIGLVVKPDSSLKGLPEELLIRMEKDLGEFSIADQDMIVDAVLTWDIDRLVQEVFLKKLKVKLNE